MMEKIDRKEIDRIAKLARFEIYQRAKRSHSTVPHVLQLFRPDHAASVHGITYDDSSPLGTHGVGKDRYEVAGLIDLQNNIIRVSPKFPYEIQRFTGAHELGHYFLHADCGMTLHRDRPLDGASTGLDKREREANYFAGVFLAPDDLVKKAFTARFGSKPLHLTDGVAFALKGTDMHDLMRTSGTGSRQLARAVAAATRFGSGNRFDSLADNFGLSITAMAIRLEECGLVEELGVVID
jgi:hypothetical protein